MKLTPLDIKKQEFKKGLRGFDPIEVESFLEMVAEEYERVIREKNALADEVLKLKTQLQDYQNVERTLQDTLVAAQESTKASRENSEREADTIIKEAELKAERILEHSKIHLSELRNEMLVIKAQKDSFSRRLKHLLQSQMELLDVLELDDLGFDEYEDSEEQENAPNQQDDEVQFEGVDDVLPPPPDSGKAEENASSIEEPPRSRSQQAPARPDSHRPQFNPPSHLPPTNRGPSSEAGNAATNKANAEDNHSGSDNVDSRQDQKSRISDHLVYD